MMYCSACQQTVTVEQHLQLKLTRSQTYFPNDFTVVMVIKGTFFKGAS